MQSHSANLGQNASGSGSGRQSTARNQAKQSKATQGTKQRQGKQRKVESKARLNQGKQSNATQGIAKQSPTKESNARSKAKSTALRMIKANPIKMKAGTCYGV